jgi:hypothetical protein
LGEVQAAQPPPSRRQSKVELPSEEWNVNVGSLSLLKLGGPVSTVVSGGAESSM